MLKNSDIKAYLSMPFNKDIEDDFLYYYFKKCNIITNHNDDILKLIYDVNFNDIQYEKTKKQQVKLVLEESNQAFDSMHELVQMAHISKTNRYNINLLLSDPLDYHRDNKINFSNIKIKLKIGEGDPFNMFSRSSIGVYPYLNDTGVDLLGFQIFENHKDINLGYMLIQKPINKDLKYIYLKEAINVKFPELKEFVIARDHEMKLSMAAVLRFLITHICECLFGKTAIIGKDKTTFYNSPQKLINMLKAKKYLEKKEADYIKKGSDNASKILHGKLEADYDNLEISFICLLKCINK